MEEGNEGNHAGAASAGTPPVTRLIASAVRAYRFEALPSDVVFLAKQCLLDWLGVTLAGSREPLTAILREEIGAEGGNRQATLVGSGERVSTAQAALVNGAASHALDFDDVEMSLMSGHPSVPVIPALLALAETSGAGGRAFITAFVAGFETECRVGALVMPSHYSTGWHSTGTLGTFGSAAACSHLFGLDEEQWLHAFGIAGAQAAGLKSMFGTMCKPFHAGKAAANGLLAASLAARGFTSNPEVLETAQGFGATQTTTYNPGRALAGLGETFAVRNVLFKYHAACYGTHASIEGVLRLKARQGIAPGKVRAIALRVPLSAPAMCNIQEPRTALEGKFSLRFTAALSLGGDGTQESDFTDAAVRRPDLVSLRDRVTVHPDERMGPAEAETTITLADGRSFSETVDMNRPATDLDEQWNRLAGKFRSLAVPVAGEARAGQLLAAVRRLEDVGSMAEIAALAVEPAAVAAR